MTGTVLILGSAPEATVARDWPRPAVDAIVAINNAWRIRDDWDFLIHPEDFDPARLPDAVAHHQCIVTAADYVPVQNALGGFVYAGGTMAFTAGYWALGALRPRCIAYFGCNMVYPQSGPTHFYGTGDADPLRADVTLRNLEAKSARLALIAAEAGCRCVNLSGGESRLVFPQVTLDDLPDLPPALPPARAAAVAAARDREAALGYFVATGRYWQEEARFDPAQIDALDALWLAAWRG